MRTKAALAILIILCSFSGLLAESVDVNHFLLMPTASGTSGYIDNPAAYVLASKQFTLALHMDTYVFKFNYGFLNIMEAGTVINFGHLSDIVNGSKDAGFWDSFRVFFDAVSESTAFDFKWRAIGEEDYPVSVAFGVKKFPLSMFESGPWNSFAVYGVASRKINDMSFSAGMKKTVGHDYMGFIADASKVVSDTVLLIGEYDENQFNAGVKMSLNYNVNVEFYVRDILNVYKAGEIGEFLRSYFIFGISYLQ